MRLAAELLFFLVGIAGTAAASPQGGLGIGYVHAVSGAISRPYGGGISFHAMGEIPLRPSIRMAAEVGFHRSSGRLSHPDFVDAAKGTLESIPIDLIARYEIPQPGVIRPHVGGGIELLWMKETFSYRMLTRDTSRNPGSRLGIGGTLVAGVDRISSPHLRLEASASFVPLQRRATAGDSGIDVGAITGGFFGARVLWMIP